MMNISTHFEDLWFSRIGWSPRPLALIREEETLRAVRESFQMEFQRWNFNRWTSWRTQRRLLGQFEHSSPKQVFQRSDYFHWHSRRAGRILLYNIGGAFRKSNFTNEEGEAHIYLLFLEKNISWSHTNKEFIKSYGNLNLRISSNPSFELHFEKNNDGVRKVRYAAYIASFNMCRYQRHETWTQYEISVAKRVCWVINYTC